MSTALTHVRTLLAVGVEFATDGERIRWRNSEGRMTPEIIGALAAEKQVVIDLLTSRQHDLDMQNETYEERAAILEYDGGLPREEAERQAAVEAGYNDLTKYNADL